MCMNATRREDHKNEDQDALLSGDPTASACLSHVSRSNNVNFALHSRHESIQLHRHVQEETSLQDRLACL